MTFSLFGFQVEVQPFFWVTALFLGSPILRSDGPKAAILVWIAVLFVSILIHELGHAFAFRRYKVDSTIALHGMGGTTYGRVLLPLGRRQSIVVSLAGPFAGFLLGGLMYGALRLLPPGVHDRLPFLVQF